MCVQRALLFKMDKKTLEIMLDKQLESMKSFMSVLVESVRSEIKDLRNENVELRRSLEFTQKELDDLKGKTNKELKILETVKDENHGERLRALEDYSRRINLRIDGIPEQRNETDEQVYVKVQKILKDKLDVNSDFSVVHRLGKIASQDRPRTVIVKFNSIQDRNKCIRLKHLLKETNIFLNEDFSKATLEIRKGKMSELREKRSQGYIAYFSGTRIITKTRPATHSDHQSQSRYPLRSGSQQ